MALTSPTAPRPKADIDGDFSLLSPSRRSRSYMIRRTGFRIVRHLRTVFETFDNHGLFVGTDVIDELK